MVGYPQISVPVLCHAALGPTGIQLLLWGLAGLVLGGVLSVLLDRRGLMQRNAVAQGESKALPLELEHGHAARWRG